MSEGMRRPPRIWEQKLEAMIKGTRTGFGAASTSPVVGAPTPGPGGPGEDPVDPPVLDPPEGDAPRKPANASVFAAIGGLSILWTGLDSNGVPVPVRSRVQVHVSTTTGFTPSEGTLRGLLAPGERLVLTDLTSGTTYFVRFVLVAPDGSIGEASDQVSAVAGFVLSTNIGTGVISADMVSFDATAIGGIQQFVGTTAPAITGSGATQQPKDGSTWINTSNLSYYTLTNGVWVQRQWGQAAISAGAISTGQLAAGAITADSAIIANGAIGNAKIADAAITNAKIQNATIEAAKIASLNADVITAGTITGRQFRTAASGARIKMADGSAEYGLHSIEFYNDAGTRVSALFPIPSSLGNVFAIAGNSGVFGSFFAQDDITTAGNVIADSVRPVSDSIVFQGYRQSSLVPPAVVTDQPATDVIMRLNADHSQENQAKFLVEANGDVVSRTNSFGGFSDARFKENITPAREYLNDLRDVEIVTFNWPGSDQKLLGVTAQQLQAVFPSMVDEDAEGTLSVRYSVFVPMLITAVQELADKVDDLTARIEALEA